MGGKHYAFLNWCKDFNFSCANQVGNAMQPLLMVKLRFLIIISNNNKGQTLHSKYPGAINAFVSKLTYLCIGMTVAPAIYINPLHSTEPFQVYYELQRLFIPNRISSLSLSLFHSHSKLSWLKRHLFLGSCSIGRWSLKFLILDYSHFSGPQLLPSWILQTQTDGSGWKPPPPKSSTGHNLFKGLGWC